METQLAYPRRAVEDDGTVHAARYTGPHSFTTACAVYPAPVAERLDARSALNVTCPGCLNATCPGVGEYGHGLTGTTVHVGCCPASR